MESALVLCRQGDDENGLHLCCLRLEFYNRSQVDKRFRREARDAIVSVGEQLKEPSVGKEEVKRFWESEPLFSGEARKGASGEDFFREHERVVLEDCFAGGVEEFYFQGLAGKRVLDVGCGPGFWVRRFCERGLDVTAVDLTETAVRLTKQSLEIFGHNALLCVGDAERLPFAGESFDHVNCQGVIHHTPDTEACIREFHRLLKPGGSVLLSVYFKNFLLRHPGLLRLARVPLELAMRGLKGRGREKMLLDFRNADDLVRLYDGVNNPLGKCYTFGEMEAMMAPFFEITHRSRHFFPLRAVRIPLPRSFHKNVLHRRFGLMIVIGGRKR